MRSEDDRTTAARIRDAAIREFAANGVAATSVRTIAAAARVSPGLVIHHFGSKDALRVACDEHVAAIIRELKQTVLTSGGAPDVMGAFRSAGEIPAAKYLARTLVDGSPHVADLVDELVHDAVGYLAAGVEAGTIQPSGHERERAAILTIWGLGALVLHEHLERLIGVDITADFSSDPAAGAAYMTPVLEIYGRGLITEAAATEMTRAVQAAPQVSTEEKETA